MIRVTFGECVYTNYANKVMEFNDYHMYRNFIENCQFAYTVTKSIVKFEKQVKDLTLEEVYKLGLEGQPLSLSIIIMEIYEGMSIDERSMNDYIDITSIVKGQVE